MKRFNKVTQRKRNRDFHAVMREWLDTNATKNEDGLSYLYEIETKHGKLLITLHDSDAEDGSDLYSVYCRFEDVDRAKKALCRERNGFYSMDGRLNPHSGKWNFHQSIAGDAQIFATYVIDMIKGVLCLTSQKNLIENLPGRN